METLTILLNAECLLASTSPGSLAFLWVVEGCGVPPLVHLCSERHKQPQPVRPQYIACMEWCQNAGACSVNLQCEFSGLGVGQVVATVPTATVYTAELLVRKTVTVAERERGRGERGGGGERGGRREGGRQRERWGEREGGGGGE